jgi:hypothetical protein
MDYRVRGFTRDVKGRKHYIDHKINSIQDYLAKNIGALRDARRQRLPGEHLPHEDAHEGIRPRQLPVRGEGEEPVVQGAHEDRGAPEARDRRALPRRNLVD